MFRLKFTLDDLNMSIITPLIKDKTKSHSDQSIIRPISTSESLATIYESIILDLIDASQKMCLTKWVSLKQDHADMQCTCSKK
jgi:hypothetical protein